MEDKPKKEFYSLVTKLNNRKTRVGYALKTDRGTIWAKVDEHYDANKIGRAVMVGFEIEKR